MVLNSYKTVKKHGFKNIYKVNFNGFKKRFFTLKPSFFRKQLSDKDIDKCLNKNFLPKVKFKENACKRTAELAAKNCFEIFGKVICFEDKIDWHIDPSSKKKPTQWKNAFYQDIKININNTTSFDKYHPDIKVPWELSRLQHLPALSITSDLKTFNVHVNSWIDNNPFLIGVNWVCPMDVAIRAINLIYGFYLSKDPREEFTTKLINSLYDHAIYLENNFEIFYKPNNHYIADLLGYFYLCFLFDHIKHFQKAKIKTYKKILEQFNLQIQDDGTCYEGSTSYHKLVTEMFLHFYYLCKKNNIDLPEYFLDRLKKAEQFIKDCTDGSGNFVQIGDNDSGKILSNAIDILKKTFNVNVSKQSQLSHYPNFGISIIKNNNWHITYKHPTYNKKQPTGHFHQDVLSITLSYDGIPILVDPGSYIYTANKAWRNRMRGYDSHNTFYLNSNNDLEKQDLFLLNKIEQNDTSEITTESNKIIIKNYAMHHNTKAFRGLTFDNKEIIIKDWWQGALNKICYWNFIFHPKINIRKISEKTSNVSDHESEKTFNVFEIFYKDTKIFYLKSNLNFKHQAGYYSSGYGKIEKCTKLFAQKSIDGKENIIILQPAKT